jgi:drug/metabolite transporter (DMT)-like permease
MDWITLSLLAPALLTGVMFIDKYVLTDRVQDVRGVPLYQSAAAVCIVMILSVAHPWTQISMQDAALILLAGMVGTFGAVLYFFALAESNTSDVAAFLQLTPAFTLVLATILLHEQLSELQLVGFGLVLVPVLALSAEQSGGKLRVSRPLYLIVLGDVLFALSSVIVKFSSGSTPLLPIIMFESLGVVLAGVLLFAAYPGMRWAFLHSLRVSGTTTLAIMFGNEALYVISKAITFLAITLGPVALVSVLGGTQVLYGLIIGVLFSLWFPRVFHEHTSWRFVLRRGGWMLAIFAGIAFIQISS